MGVVAAIWNPSAPTIAHADGGYITGITGSLECDGSGEVTGLRFRIAEMWTGRSGRYTELVDESTGEEVIFIAGGPGNPKYIGPYIFENISSRLENGSFHSLRTNEDHNKYFFLQRGGRYSLVDFEASYDEKDTKIPSQDSRMVISKSPVSDCE